MTGKTDFDTYFEQNYNNLRAFCGYKNIQEDSLNDVYLKIKKQMIATGMTVQQFNSYVKKALWNLKLDENKSLRVKKTINFEDDDLYRLYLEEQLNNIESDHCETIRYREEIEYFTKMLFKFIETRSFSDIDVFIFKSYFLVDKMTYRKLEKEISININKIKRTIRAFKSDIKNNFIDWLRENE